MPLEIKIHALKRKKWKVKDMCTTLYQTHGGVAHSFSSKKKKRDIPWETLHAQDSRYKVMS